MAQRFLVTSLNGDRSKLVERVLAAALQAVDPEQAVQQALKLENGRLEVGGEVVDLDKLQRVRLVGVGKAAVAMGRGAWKMFGERVTDGLLIAKHLQENNGGLPERVRVLRGNHPVPGDESVESAAELARFLQGGREADLVVCLISGGGSALMTLPYEGVSLADMQELTRLLLASGANITEINTLRKHLDRVKGGGLARLAAPAQVITLVLSDVIGSPLDVIASGPTVADSSTFGQALGILQKYELHERAPKNILNVIERGVSGELPETMKAGDPILALVQNVVVGSNYQAAQAGLAQARQEGMHTLLLTTYLQGEAAQVGEVLASLLKQSAETGQPIARPACLVAGGETTVTLRGKGLGGRNQEMALGAAFLLSGTPDVALVTLGTDGEDGPTDAAGAVVTGDTLARAQELGLDALAYLRENDSYHFFEALGDLLQPGPTGTNVNDLAFLFAF